MFRDSMKFASRSMDDTLKLWDIRKPQSPIYAWDELVNMQAKTGITISPNEKVLVTGTSVRKGFGYGFMVAVNTMTGERISETPISKDSVVTVNWHHTINQIFVGSADAKITVLYDPEISSNGIMRSITR
jgi:WD repeat-containing protein 70